LSRLAWRGDYMIKPEILQQTMEQLQFFPQLDTFATRTMRQCNRVRAEDGQVTGKSLTQSTSRRPISCTNDKYFIGEQLFRDLAADAGLVPTTIQQMIDNSNWDTWRKHRAGLTIMARYLKLNEIDSMAQLGERPDIHVVNVIAWLNDLGGKTRKSNLIALKTHTSVVLGQFSKMPNISDSPLIKQFSRCLNLNIDSKARYNVIWDIQKLFGHISNSTFSTPVEIQMKAMALLVSIFAARMTELYVLLKLYKVGFSPEREQTFKKNHYFGTSRNIPFLPLITVVRHQHPSFVNLGYNLLIMDRQYARQQ
ncbi:MAG: hypothetical protein EZS28_040137, partial [Streblomastix strix]